jgi:uncharacterized membrane protein YgcG
MRSAVILLGIMFLAACGPSNDNKPVLEKERQTLDTAKAINQKQQQEAQKQQQEMEKQTQ